MGENKETSNFMNQQDAQSDERFVAVHVDQLGVDELNPELTKVRDIVTPFLPANYKLSRVTNATREIVNGFKYEITFVMQNEVGDDVYCEMDVLEKPWLVRDLKKFRKMTYNNCSLENESDEDDRIRFQYEINPTFVDQRPEFTQVDLKDMEDQIITTKPRQTTTSSNVEDEIITLPPLDPSSKNLLDDFFTMNNYFSPPQNPTTTTTSTSPPMSNLNLGALDEMFGFKKVVDSQALPQLHDDKTTSNDDDLQQEKQVESLNSSPTKNETALKELEDEIKKVFSELFQSDPDFQMNIIALINRRDDSTVQENYNRVISILANKLKDRIETYNERRSEENDAQQVTINPLNAEGETRRKRSIDPKFWDLANNALMTLDRYDFDDEKRILVDILSVKDVKGKNNAFNIEAAVAHSRCQENSHETSECDEKIDQSSIKICIFEVTIDGD